VEVQPKLRSKRRLTVLATALVMASAAIGVFGATRGPASPSAAKGAPLSAHIIACGSAPVSSILGRVARVDGTTSRTGMRIVGTRLTTSSVGSLYLVGDTTADLPAGITSGAISVPSKHSAFRSCNYTLSDNARDSALKASAQNAFSTSDLVTANRLAGPGIIWMVADDPTSSADLLVMVDVETPLTATSPGTIKTLVAAVDIGSGKVLGVAVAPW
jgi:hypothetical protein